MKNIVLFVAIIIVTFSSLINIYEKRGKIVNKILPQYEKDKDKDSEYEESTADFEMANKIINGGYILVFRHAEREKWIDIQIYDAMELQNKLDADKEYFKYAVCLSDRGNIQAKMMGEYIKLLKIPIHKVISSPSCRARQTAQLAFGRIDVIKNVFLHKGPYYETEKEFRREVKKELLKIEVPENSNVIVSAHNQVITEEVLDEIEFISSSKNMAYILEEGGFYVIAKRNNKLVLVHRFYEFKDFVKIFMQRPYN